MSIYKTGTLDIYNDVVQASKLENFDTKVFFAKINTINSRYVDELAKAREQARIEIEAELVEAELVEAGPVEAGLVMAGQIDEDGKEKRRIQLEEELTDIRNEMKEEVKNLHHYIKEGMLIRDKVSKVELDEETAAVVMSELYKFEGDIDKFNIDNDIIIIADEYRRQQSPVEAYQLPGDPEAGVLPMAQAVSGGGGSKKRKKRKSRRKNKPKKKRRRTLRKRDFYKKKKRKTQKKRKSRRKISKTRRRKL